MSLIKSKNALKQYDIRENLEIEKTDKRKGNNFRIMQAITDRNFWHDLEDMIKILKPLHDC